MEAVDAKGLKTVVVRPDIDQKQLVVMPEFYQESDYTLEVVLKDGDKTVAKKEVPCSNHAVVVLPVKNMKLWSPETPYLYDLSYTVKDKDGKTVEPTEKETKAAEKKAKEGAAALEAAMKAGDTKKVAKLVKEYGCTVKATDGIVDQLRIIEGIEIAFLLYQTGNPVCFMEISSC